MTSRPLLSSLRNVLFAREQRFDPSLRGSVYAVSTAPAAVAARTPSHAERCRTLFARARHGVLSTLAREPKGFPFGSLVAVACDEDGQPLLLLSALAEHTQNLEVAADASLLVVGDTTHFPGVGASREAAGAGEGERAARAARDALALPRVTLLGPCTRVGEEDAARFARDIFLAAHPEATAYAGFKDFAMYRLAPVGLRYVGGFGRMSWVSAAEYARAEPDPLAASEATMITHMNDDHPDSVLAYARALAHIDGATRALITSIDRYGFDLLAVTPDGERRARIPFPDEVESTDGARRALIALVRDARTALTLPG